MSARDPDAPPEPGVNIPSFGPDSAAMMDPAAIQAALAAQGDSRDPQPGPGFGGMNFQQFMSLDDGTRRRILNMMGAPGQGDIIDSNDPMNSGHNLATKLWLTAGQAGRERFGDPDNPGFAKAMLGPDPEERAIRTNINPVGDDTAQSIMSSGNPPAAGWRKVRNPNLGRTNTPGDLVWRFDDWPDLFQKQAPTLPLAPPPPPRAPAQPMPSAFGRGGSFGAFVPPTPAPTPPPAPATSGQNYVNQFNNWLKTGVWA